ncbi:L-aminopeptidase/D-esterase [Corynebacterium deserti GIMN1.010]|uniref:L-aminopeptidase/D-esterase n=1 Tax=Corynebacterium deserti GIMN1.010 TaxID=931089 RepID=A0A0M4CHI9_9CORY|nr:P1 family peptidase [Corynebacterium deserti]ALC06640.1 L-aminopeptidase/D-esterase [Corynebacterium deserti GIMN1.010]
MLIDVPGFLLGHVTKEDTGCSVVVAPHGAFAGVDVRGGGPGTRETDLLEAHNTVQQIHAVALCGGSAFGLAAADGVMTALEERGIGFPVLPEGPIVPIVPGAVIFDLLVGDSHNRPTAADGALAVEHAFAGTHHGSGNVGAGTGATAGRLRGGFGQSSTVVDGFHIAAAVVANPAGEVVDVSTGALFSRPEMVGEGVDKLKNPAETLNTTIGVVATDAPVTKAQAKRLALSAHDGLARAVRPSHLPMDGDTFFAMSSGDGSGVDPLTLAKLSAAAAQCVENAIIDAILSASPGLGLKSFRELLP